MQYKTVLCCALVCQAILPYCILYHFLYTPLCSVLWSDMMHSLLCHPNVTSYHHLILHCTLPAAVASGQYPRISTRQRASLYMSMKLRTSWGISRLPSAFAPFYGKRPPQIWRIVHAYEPAPCMQPTPFGFAQILTPVRLKWASPIF